MSVQEYDRPNSAYMLFYERSEALEPFERLRAAAAAAASLNPSPNPAPDAEPALPAAGPPSEVTLRADPTTMLCATNRNPCIQRLGTMSLPKGHTLSAT